MSTDIAELGIRVRSDDAKTAEKNLDDLTAAGDRTEAAIKKLEKASSAANDNVKKVGKAAAEVDTKVTKAEKSVDKLADEFEATARKAQETTAAFERNADAGKRHADAMGDVASGTDDAMSGLDDMTGTTEKASKVFEDMVTRAKEFGVFFVIGAATAAFTVVVERLAAELRELYNDALSVEDALERVDRITRGLNESSDLLQMTYAEMREIYRDSAEEVRKLAIFQANLRTSLATVELNEHVRALQGVTQEMRAGGEFGPVYNRQIQSLANAFDMSFAAAQDFEAMLDRLDEARTLDEQSVVVQEIADFLDTAVENASNIPPEFAKALDEMITLLRETDAARAAVDEVTEAAGGMTDGIQNAADAAADLTRNLLAAAAVRISRINAQESQEFSGRGGDPRDFTGGPTYMNDIDYTSVQDMIDEFNAAQARSTRGASGRSRRRGGGRGSNDAQREHNRLLKEAERIYNDTRTEAEAYAIELGDLKELHEAGYLDAETYARAVDQVTEAYEEASKSGSFWADQLETFAKSASQALFQNKSLADSFLNLASAIGEALFQAALFGSGPLGGTSLGGGILGSALGGAFNFDPFAGISFSGGGYTGDGPRSGGVDGRGGYFAVVHPRETIVDHMAPHAPGAPGKGFRTGDVSVSLAIDARGQSQDIVGEIDRRIARKLPGMVKAAVSAGAEGRRRGYADA